MKVYTCTSFDGFYPVGSSAAVVAKTRPQAVKLLVASLKKSGLAGTVEGEPMRAKHLTEIFDGLDLWAQPSVHILQDGKY